MGSLPVSKAALAATKKDERINSFSSSWYIYTYKESIADLQNSSLVATCPRLPSGPGWVSL